MYSRPPGDEGVSNILQLLSSNQPAVPMSSGIQDTPGFAESLVPGDDCADKKLMDDIDDDPIDEKIDYIRHVSRTENV
jgi:hypothetical protein